MKIQTLHHKKIDELIQFTKRKTLNEAIAQSLKDAYRLFKQQDKIYLKYYKNIDKTLQLTGQQKKLNIDIDISEETLNYFQENNYPLYKILIAYVNYLKFKQIKDLQNEQPQAEKVVQQPSKQQSAKSKYNKQQDSELVLDPEAIKDRLKSKSKDKNTVKEEKQKTVSNKDNTIHQKKRKSKKNGKNGLLSSIKTPTEIQSLKEELQEHKKNINHKQPTQTSKLKNKQPNNHNNQTNKKKQIDSTIDTGISFIESDSISDIMSDLEEKYGLMLVNSKNIGSHTIYELYDTADKETVVARYDNYTHKTVMLTTDTPVDSAVCTNYITELKKKIHNQKLHIRKNKNNMLKVK